MVLVVLVVSFALPLRSWFAQRGELDGLARLDIASDQEAITSSSDSSTGGRIRSYVEAQARERLRWVKPGDVGFIVIGDDPAEPADPGAEVAAGGLWWQRLWSSVEEVDQGTALDAGQPRRSGPIPANE